MYSIVRWCLGNRPVVILFTLVLMAAGAVSMFRLNQELLPSVEFPAVYVLVPDPGAGPEQVDRSLAQPLASGLAGIPRLKHLTSTSSQGFAQIALQFDLDSALRDDLEATNQRLGQVQLPPSAGRPVVQTFSFAALPSMTYSLAARDGNLERITGEARELIAPALAGAGGLAQVKIVGGAQRTVSVTLDGSRLAERGISVQQVQQALSGAQVDLPAGESLQAGRSLPVEVTGSVRTAADLRELPIGSAPLAAGPGPPSAGPALPSFAAAALPGAVPSLVRLGDLAAIAEVSAPLNGIARTDGAPSLEIQVVRAASGNAVQLSQEVRRRLAGVRLDPADRLRLVSDAADSIQASLNDLVLEGLLGAVLAVLVIFAFLGSLRATLVTAISLPTSVLVALLGTALGGFSLNVLTLAGLTIAVGRIVDDAIVVLENSYRHLQQGDDARTAALRGATEVSSAVLSSTLTTVAVFLPIGVVGGIISRFFLPFSVTVTIALLASLLVALTVIPVLVSLLLERMPATPGGRLGGLQAAYRTALAWSLSARLPKAAVLATAAVLLVVASISLIWVPRNFFGFGPSRHLLGVVTLPPGTSAEQTSEQLAAFEREISADPAVSLVQVTIASSDYGAYTGAFSANEARLGILLKSKEGAEAASRRLQRRLESLYGPGRARLSVESFGPPSTGFSASAGGRDPNALREASDRILAELSRDRELGNVRSDLAAEKPELLVTVDSARAAARGLSPQLVALAVAGALTPRPAGTLGPGGPPVVVRLDPASTGADRLAGLPLGPATAVGDVAAITTTLAPASITRVDGAQRVTVNAEVLATDVSGASDRATRRLQGLSLPAGVRLETGGATNDINDSFNQMFIAMGVAVGLVFLILVAFFRSVITPFVILFTMPLALIGGFGALFATRQALGLPALLGLLMVFGIVVSNAILLIDFVERNWRDRSLAAALMDAGGVRLRPILMTAVATIVALLPVAVGVSTAGGGGLISQGLAVVVEGGLISSTALTLIVIPVVYSILKRRGGGIPAAQPGPGATGGRVRRREPPPP